MSVRVHVPIDRLTALAMTARGPQNPQSSGDAENAADREALAHVGQCDACATELTRLSATLDSLRDSAWSEADAAFDETALDSQRSRILDRLAHLGQAARVLRFPVRPREAAMPVSHVSRRWVSMAAAAGLIIGMVAGQFLPTLRRDEPRAVEVPARASEPLIVQATSTPSLLSDDELLARIETAVQVRRVPALRALDELTPRAGDLREIR
jgi:hypothetical protein